MQKSIAFKLLFVAFSVLLAEVLQAQEKESDEGREFYKLMEKMKAEDPAGFKQYELLAISAAELLLARLGYGVGPIDGRLSESDKAALKRYQAQKGLPLNGNALSFETIRSIKRDSDDLDSRAIWLPSFQFIDEFWDRGYFKAEGTWTIVGSSLASPLQSSIFLCRKEMNTCTEFTAKVSGEPRSGSCSVAASRQVTDTERDEGKEGRWWGSPGG